MPYPLAHPAAVLPLRRFCPKRLNFPALVIGSVTPDLGYAFGSWHVDWFSHRFWAGSFGFCLPTGLVLVATFYLLRRRVAGFFPERYQQALLSACQRPAGSVLAVTISVLIGAWTHNLLDSITHRDGWLVEHLAILRITLPWLWGGGLNAYSLLYAVCTFGGVLWLALCYVDWLQNSFEHPASNTIGMKSVWCLLLASGTLIIAEVSRRPHQILSLIPESIITVLLLVGFVVATAAGFRRPLD